MNDDKNYSPEDIIPTEEADATEEYLELEPESDGIKEAAEENDELSLLIEELPELSGVNSLEEAVNTVRYNELRALGLTVREAYILTAKKKAPDTRAHLTDSYPRPARAPRTTMTQSELREARELFGELSDAEIISLYKKVTK